MSANVVELLTIGFGTLLFATILIMGFVDCRRLVLPDCLNLVLAAGGVGQAFIRGDPGFVNAGAGALVGFLALYTVAKLFRRARGIDGLGFGDQKFAASAGLWLGWEHIAPMLAIASITALGFVVIRWMQTGTFDRYHRMPFGPFLGFGTAVCWLGAVVFSS
ncbi:MAG: prepilin peptidase [Bradyrhizobium sp.]|nr:A24 family peptidase [Pseudomonadota bacterium]MDE2471414.1 prepilin peptidase [Bradyrhizobium sp.]